MQTLVSTLLDFFLFYLLLFYIGFFNKTFDLIVILFISLLYFLRMIKMKKKIRIYNMIWILNEIFIIIGCINIYLNLNFKLELIENEDYIIYRMIDNHNLVVFILFLQIIKFIFIIRNDLLKKINHKRSNI